MQVFFALIELVDVLDRGRCESPKVVGDQCPGTCGCPVACKFGSDAAVDPTVGAADGNRPQDSG